MAKRECPVSRSPFSCVNIHQRRVELQPERCRSRAKFGILSIEEIDCFSFVNGIDDASAQFNLRNKPILTQVAGLE